MSAVDMLAMLSVNDACFDESKVTGQDFHLDGDPITVYMTR